MTRITGSKKRKIVLKDWGQTALEVGKWILVLWLLWPLRHATSGPVDFTRVLLGILLFIVFAGKVFYDTIIMGILRQRRTSVKQDVITLIGMVAGISLVVGLLIVFVGYAIVQLYQSSNRPQDE
jgi:hypothetical protein